MDGIDNMTPARLLLENAIDPHLPKYQMIQSDSSCWLCGYPCESMYEVNKAIGLSFTDHADVSCPESPYICVPCAWVLSGRPPDTFRAWSIVFRTDREPIPSHPSVPTARMAKWTHFAARNELSEAVDILINPPIEPWFCCLSYTGKVHTVPFTAMNCGNGRWTVRADKDNVSCTPKVFRDILFHAASLYVFGFSRKEILTNNPHPSKLAKHGIKTWKRHINKLIGWVDSGVLELAVFLLNKKGIDYVIRRTR